MSGGSLLGTLIAPRRTFASLRDMPKSAGALPVVIAGLAWASLSLVLHANGEVPSRPAPMIPAEVHYAAQAAFVVPLFVLSWLVLSAVAGRIAGKGSYAALGYAYGVPLIVTWALPDAIALGAFGFEALAPLVRVIAPVTALFTLTLATLAVRVTTDAEKGRSFAAALAGLISQALLGAWALR